LVFDATKTKVTAPINLEYSKMHRKFVFIFFLSLFCALSASAQTEEPQEPLDVGVESFWLARDNGDGKVGDETEGFYTNDIPIHCIVQLNSRTPATVKMNLVAVKVQGVKAETKVITVSFKTNGKQSRVNFTGKPDDDSWTAGNYRIDLFIDGKPAGSKEFTIEKTAAQIEKEKQKPAPKTSTKPKTVKRYKKN
jgi:hypothetical protein